MQLRWFPCPPSSHLRACAPECALMCAWGEGGTEREIENVLERERVGVPCSLRYSMSQEFCSKYVIFLWVFPLGFPFNQFYKIAIMSINQHDWGVSIISINHRYICLVQGCQHYPTLCLCANSQLPENQGNHWLALREKLQKQQRKSVTFSDAKKGTQMGTDVVEAPWASRRKPKPFAHRGG